MISLVQPLVSTPRITGYQNYFDRLPAEEQNEILRDYMGTAVQRILHAFNFPTHQDGFCMLEASRLVREDRINLRSGGINSLADEIREFLDGRQEQIFPNWQKGLLSWLDKKVEQ